MPIQLLGGYNKVPRFDGYRGPTFTFRPLNSNPSLGTEVPPVGGGMAAEQAQAQAEVLPPEPEAMPELVAVPAPSPWPQRIIVYGGVPVCAWLVVTKRSWLAGLLGAGILYTFFSGGFTMVGPPSQQ